MEVPGLPRSSEPPGGARLRCGLGAVLRGSSNGPAAEGKEPREQRLGAFLFARSQLPAAPAVFLRDVLAGQQLRRGSGGRGRVREEAERRKNREVPLPAVREERPQEGYYSKFLFKVDF